MLEEVIAYLSALAVELRIKATIQVARITLSEMQVIL